MNFIEVLPADNSYSARTYLTYHSDDVITPGQIVFIPVRKKILPAIVMKTLAKTPSFKTLKINRTTNLVLSAPVVELIQWMLSFYPVSYGAIGQLFTPPRIEGVEKINKQKTPETYVTTVKSQLIPTTEQQKAIAELQKNTGPVLLHGDTGSGKTLVYATQILDALSRGLSVVVLVPEIGLIPQLAAALGALIHHPLYIQNSGQSKSVRQALWETISSSEEPIVILGPRSALFLPYRTIGLVIVDEFHEYAYRQEQSPYYDATAVAGMLAKIHSARCILGSATPAIHVYWQFKQKKFPIIRMSGTAITSNASSVHLVDLKNTSLFSQSRWLSDILLGTMQRSIESGGQTLLFLNRRGTARLISCKWCGWTAACLSCSVPLTYHADKHTLTCHTCGRNSSVPTTCKNCNKTDLLFSGVGTKQIESDLNRLFPSVKIARFDKDTSRIDSLKNTYSKTREGDSQILIGTQMITKGLDFPKVDVVGVLLADTALSFPDYTSDEITYQQIVQVIGRTGRGHRKNTHAIIQSFRPDHPVINQAAKKDYVSFYKDQILYRKQFRLPPFSYVLKACFRHKNNQLAEKHAARMVVDLQNMHTGVEIIGPAPSFIEKTHGFYNWHIICKSTNRQRLIALAESLPRSWIRQIDPDNML